MYHQHHEHRVTQQQPMQQQQTNGYAPNAPNAAPNAAAPAPAPAPVVASNASSAGALDHALLESLFYSEMMFDSTTLSAPSLPTEHDTPHTIVEKEILRDFGVGSGTSLFQDPAQSSPESASPVAPTDTPHYGGNHLNPQNASSSYATGVLPPQISLQQQQQQQQQHPIHQHQQQQQQQSIHHPQGAPLHHQAPPQSSTAPLYAHNTSTAANYTVPSGVTSASAVPQPTTTSDPQQHPQSVGMPVYMDTQATATAAAAAAAMLVGDNESVKVQSSQSLPTLASPNTTLKAASMGGSYSNPNPTTTVLFAPQQGVQEQQQQQPRTTTTTNSNNKRPRVVPEQRARQLVDQFATLASRLGIDLPDSVLQSLTCAAAKNDPTLLLNDVVVGGATGGATSFADAAANPTTTTVPSASAPTALDSGKEDNEECT